LQGDILSLDLADNLVNFPTFDNPNKIVANIPYNITGAILEKFLGTISNQASNNLESMVLLMQKEVAERLLATPGNKAFGALSVRVQYVADCEWICEVPARDFYPPPKVDSAVVRLRPRLIEPPALNPRQLETLVKLGFASRRKMLRNNLKGLIEIEKLTPILEQLNLNSQTRAEDLSLQDWIRFSNYLTQRQEK
jgi:16S rRNA (adenine1518-N6/adenine1519-N6)-dimethyltransferase